ncbi:unnamed protein product, partial [Rotaria magnacalcarata]
VAFFEFFRISVENIKWSAPLAALNPHTIDVYIIVKSVATPLIANNVDINSPSFARVRVENNKLTWAFFLLSSLQPAFMIYCLFSALKYSPAAPLTTAATTTATAAATTAATATTTTIIILQFTISTILKPLSKSLISILPALYTCVAVNFVSFILSIVFAIKCIRNFDKGLKERVFHSKLDQWLQGKLSNNVSTL